MVKVVEQLIHHGAPQLAPLVHERAEEADAHAVHAVHHAVAQVLAASGRDPALL